MTKINKIYEMISGKQKKKKILLVGWKIIIILF